MDIDLLLRRFFFVYGSVAIVASCYLFSRFYVKITRKDQTEPAKRGEMITTLIEAILLLSFVSWLYTYKMKEQLTEFVATFLILFIPITYGLLDGFSRDKKLTKEERRKIKFEIDNTKEY